MAGQGQAGVSNPGQCQEVQNGRQALGQGRQNGQQMRELVKQELTRNMSMGKKRQTGNRQTENTGISAQGIIGKWRGVETSTRQVKQIRV